MSDNKTKPNYTHLTPEDMEDGKFMAELLSMLNEDERKAYLIYSSALRDMAMVRQSKQTA